VSEIEGPGAIRSWSYLHDLSTVVDSGDSGSGEILGANVEEFEYLLDIVLLVVVTL